MSSGSRSPPAASVASIRAAATMSCLAPYARATLSLSLVLVAVASTALVIAARKPSSIIPMSPMTVTLTPSSTSDGSSATSVRSRRFMRWSTSFRDLRQFSCEKAYTVSAERSHAPAHRTIVRRVSTPRSWPSATATPRSVAHRPLPSMMTATCRGRCASSSSSAPIAGSSFHDGADVDAVVDAVSSARRSTADPCRRPGAAPRRHDPFLSAAEGAHFDFAPTLAPEESAPPVSSTEAARGWAAPRTVRAVASREDDAPGCRPRTVDAPSNDAARMTLS